MKIPHIYIILLFVSTICRLTAIHGADEISGSAEADRDSIPLSIEKGINLFGAEGPLQITLTFDIRKFLNTKSKPEYFDAIITIKSDDSTSLTRNIKLKARGEMRREYCDFPPILLKFKEDDNEPEQILGNRKFKLVTHCKLSSLHEKYVLKEYLVYRLYNQVTPYSFRTRLAEIKYIDINKPDRSFSTYGFLIEDEDAMAERIKAVPYDNLNLTQKHMVPDEMVRTALFQYMIGNTDWGVSTQHNVRILKSTELLTDKAIPVAYDFDYSGFVSTNYAIPDQGLPIELVTERYYLGICAPEEVVAKVVDEFGTLKSQFLTTIDNFDFLPEDSRKQAESYINSFYKMYKNQKTLINTINNSCKRY